jgi:hypothetical protein
LLESEFLTNKIKNLVVVAKPIHICKEIASITGQNEAPKIDIIIIIKPSPGIVPKSKINWLKKISVFLK